MMLVGAAAHEEGHRTRGNILPRQAAERALNLDLAFRERQIRQRFQTLVRRNIGEQRIDVSDTNARQHFGTVFRRERKVAHSSCPPCYWLTQTTSRPAPRSRFSPSSRC